MSAACTMLYLVHVPCVKIGSRHAGQRSQRPWGPRGSMRGSTSTANNNPRMKRLTRAHLVHCLRVCPEVGPPGWDPAPWVEDCALWPAAMMEAGALRGASSAGDCHSVGMEPNHMVGRPSWACMGRLHRSGRGAPTWVPGESFWSGVIYHTLYEWVV